MFRLVLMVFLIKPANIFLPIVSKSVLTSSKNQKISFHTFVDFKLCYKTDSDRVYYKQQNICWHQINKLLEPGERYDRICIQVLQLDRFS